MVEMSSEDAELSLSMRQTLHNRTGTAKLTGQSRISPMLAAFRSNWPNDCCAASEFCDVNADADT